MCVCVCVCVLAERAEGRAVTSSLDTRNAIKKDEFERSSDDLVGSWSSLVCRQRLRFTFLCLLPFLSPHSTTPTPTRTSSPTSARGSSRGSRPAARAAAGRLPPTHPRTFVRQARFSSRGCPLGMRACTRVRVLYMINYRVHVYKITRKAYP